MEKVMADNVIHTYPVNDLVEHNTTDDGCVCGPDIMPIEREDGSYAYQVIHHSLDGREHYEDGHDWRECPSCVHRMKELSGR